MVWNRVERTFKSIYSSSFDSSTLGWKAYSYRLRRLGYRIHRVVTFLTGDAENLNGDQFVYGDITLFTGSSFAWNTEIQALFPSETAAITTEHSVTLLLCGGVIICLCLGHGSISRGAIELAESKELRLRINHGMNRRARSWFKSHLRFSIIIVVFGERKINCAWKNICCWRFCKESLGLLWL